MTFDLAKFEQITRAAVIAATNGTDQRLDVVIALLHQLLAEIRMTREEMQKQREAMEEGSVTVQHYKDIPAMDVPGRKPPGRKGK